MILAGVSQVRFLLTWQEVTLPDPCRPVWLQIVLCYNSTTAQCRTHLASLRPVCETPMISETSNHHENTQNELPDQLRESHPDAQDGDGTGQQVLSATDSPVVVQDQDLDAYRSLIRLTIGALLEGSDALLAHLRILESYSAVAASRGTLPVGSGYDEALYAFVGFVFELSDFARHGLGAAKETTATVGRVALAPVRLVTNSVLFKPVRAGLSALSPLSVEDVERWRELGRVETPHSRHLAREAVPLVIEDVITYLAGNKQVEALVDAQVELLLPKLAQDMALRTLVDLLVAYEVEQLTADPTAVNGLVQRVVADILPFLAENTEDVDLLVQQVAGNYLAYLQQKPEQVQELVQQLGDEYIAYLNKNPEQVQRLIQGQSLGMTEELLEEVRERSVSTDSALETVVRSLLGRKPREELAEPPPEVMARAATGHVSSDLTK